MKNNVEHFEQNSGTRSSTSDQEYVKLAREAGNNFERALNAAAKAGLLLDCTVKHYGGSSFGGRQIEQFDWRVHVSARRETLL